MSKSSFILTRTGLTSTSTVDQKVTKDSVSDEKENIPKSVLSEVISLQSHNGGILLTGIGLEVLSGAEKEEQTLKYKFCLCKGKGEKSLTYLVQSRLYLQTQIKTSPFREEKGGEHINETIILCFQNKSLTYYIKPASKDSFCKERQTLQRFLI